MVELEGVLYQAHLEIERLQKGRAEDEEVRNDMLQELKELEVKVEEYEITIDELEKELLEKNCI